MITIKKKKEVIIIITIIILFIATFSSYAVTLPFLIISSNNYLDTDKMDLPEVNIVEIGKNLQLYAMTAHGNEIIDENDPDTLGIYIDKTNLEGLIWESSDTTIATIDSTGLITGVKEGKAIITVQYPSGTTEDEKINSQEIEVVKLISPEIDEKNYVTDDFEIIGKMKINDKTTYELRLIKGEQQNFTFNLDVFNLPDYLFDYNKYISIRLTYLQDTKEAKDYKVINDKTGQIIEDLSKENLDKLFNIEYGKIIIDKNWTNTIKMSDYKENEIYKFTAKDTVQFPEIENDTGNNCMIYIKDKKIISEKDYNKKIKMYKEIKSDAMSGSYNEFKPEESFNFMYHIISNEKIIELSEENEIIYLGNYNDGDKLNHSFSTKYIYNDTDKDITINVKNKFTSSTNVIEKGKIQGFDWMIDTATISYVKKIDETEIENNKINNNNIVNNQIINQENIKNKDNTIIETDKLPKAGSKVGMLFSIVFIIVLLTISYKKYSKYKDI